MYLLSQNGVSVCMYLSIYLSTVQRVYIASKIHAREKVVTLLLAKYKNAKAKSSLFIKMCMKIICLPLTIVTSVHT